MKSQVFWYALGIVTGAVALKKLEQNKVPEKALKAAEKKLKD